jgi:sugar lactone lactonase YvrE
MGINFGPLDAARFVTIGGQLCEVGTDSLSFNDPHHIMTCELDSMSISTPANVEVTVNNNQGSTPFIYQSDSTGAPLTGAINPVIYSLSSANAPTNGQTYITVFGTNFGSASPTVVRIGSTNCLVSSWVSSSTLLCSTAAGTGGDHDVFVTTGALSVSKNSAFTYDSPSLTSFLPPQVPREGQFTATIGGQNFGSAPVSGVVVSVGNKEASSIILRDAGTLICTFDSSRVDDTLTRVVVDGLIGSSSGLFSIYEGSAPAAAAPTVSTLAGSGASGLADGFGTAAAFNGPTAIALSPDKTSLYIADTRNHKIRILSLSTNYVDTMAGGSGSGYADGQGQSALLNTPFSLAVSSQRNVVYVADAGNYRIRAIDIGTQVVTTVAGNGVQPPTGTNGPGLAASFVYPVAVALSANQALLYIGDYTKVRVVNLVSGSVSDVAGDFESGSVNGPASVARFKLALSIVAATNSRLYVGDGLDNKIRLIDLQTNQVSTLAGNGNVGWVDGIGENAQLALPTGLVLSDDEEFLYFADSSTNMIRRLEVAQLQVTSIAGSNTAGYADGSASTAQFNSPFGLAMPNKATLLAVDSGNDRIRRIASSGGLTSLEYSTGSSDEDTNPTLFAISETRARETLKSLLPSFDENGKSSFTVETVIIVTGGLVACVVALGIAYGYQRSRRIPEGNIKPTDRFEFLATLQQDELDVSLRSRLSPQQTHLFQSFTSAQFHELGGSVMLRSSRHGTHDIAAPEMRHGPQGVVPPADGEPSRLAQDTPPTPPRRVDTPPVGPRQLATPASALALNLDLELDFGSESASRPESYAASDRSDSGSVDGDEALSEAPSLAELHSRAQGWA